MYTSDGNRLRSIENQISEQQKVSWSMLIVGLGVGFVGMYFCVARPMAHELRTMKSEVTKIQTQMEVLTAQGSQVWETNSLLASLKMQQSQLEDARTALQSVRELGDDVAAAANKARLSRDQLTAMTSLQDRIIAEQPSVEIAGRVLDDVTLLNQRLANGQEATQVASAGFDRMRDLQDDLSAQAGRMDEVELTSQRMIALQEEIRRQQTGLDDAWYSLHGMSLLKDSLLEGARHVELAQIVADQLLAMQTRMVEQSADSEIAMYRTQKLLELNQTLSRDDLQIEASRQNLEALLDLNGKVLTAPTIAKAIESLEVLSAFQEEFIDQIQILAEMRKSLMEIGLLESTVARAVRLVKPLLELGNLQRMSDDELRSAALNILEERTGRRAERDLPNYEGKNVKDAFVPEPIDGE